MSGDGKVQAVPVKAIAEAVLEKAIRLGLTWRLRPATVMSVASDGTIRAQHDGDSKPIRVTSMVGPVAVRARVMVLKTPPAGNHIVGWVGTPAPGKPPGVLVQRFTQSGKFTVPAGARWIRAYGVGAGAGGGGVTGVSGGNGAGGGGGGGGYCESLFAAADLAAEVTITVGVGGAGGAFGTGAVGGDSSFGGLWTAGGGQGGGPATASAGDTGGGRGTGGTAAGGNVLNAPGGYGALGKTLDNRHLFVGRGGDSLLGHGGPAPVSTSGNGPDAEGHGGGGAGAIAGAVSRAGGKGFGGLVVVEVGY
ncbi:glycine-rich domain-containing protein [Micromonospora chersina]|uniref:glycine-rich domain-containing protein n=1 Tax=Micromonospora chersina TaxID=47854 RepID=UPI00371DFFDC